MIAAHTRALVALLGVLSLGGCAASRMEVEGAQPAPLVGGALRFDNEGRDRVDVYLVGETRSWRIGRLEPGQARWLAVPRDIPGSDLGRLQLVVLANATTSIDPMRDPRAVMTIRQPLGALAGQRWGFAHGQLKTLPVTGAAIR